MDSINNEPKFGGDAWLELQAFKTRQINRREKLNRHKDLINGIASQNNQQSSSSNPTSSTSLQNNNTSLNEASTALVGNHDASLVLSISYAPVVNQRHNDQEQNYTSSRSQNRATNKFALIDTDCETSASHELKPIISDQRDLTTADQCRRLVGIDTVECLLLLKLCDVALKLPIDSKSLQRYICKVRGYEKTSQATIENLLEKFAHQELITIEQPSTSLNRSNKQCLNNQDDDFCTYVVTADHTKLVEFDKSSDDIRALLLETRNADLNVTEETDIISGQSSVPTQKVRKIMDNFHSSHDSSRYLSSMQTDSALDDHGADEQTKCLQRKTFLVDSRKHQASDDVESLLSLSSTREKESKKLGEELLELLSKPTAKEKNLLESFRSADGYQVQEFCPKGTKDECRRNSKGTQACDKLHFKKIIAKHTEESLGDCSFLNTCFHMDSCKYVHYEVDYDSKHHKKKSGTNLPNNSVKNKLEGRQSHQNSSNRANQNKTKSLVSKEVIDSRKTSKSPDQQIAYQSSSSVKFTLSAEEQARIEIKNRKRFKTVLYPPQWIQCDLRYFDMSLLGKFSVVMADPPWDIHMELPYGTMSDEEMRKLNVPALQDEGVIFLWVTGRAMELGRECLALWGYERCDEIIWVKTNQLQRIIRTGRTGHWLNHGKEHCLVGIKGNPTGINRGLDCDIIVAEVRATSHKPDEIYGIIERLSPGTRKIELFGRAHNVQPNWITLGNQLDGVRLVEPSLIEAFKKLNLPYQTAEHTL